MKIVIDINEELYNYVKSLKSLPFTTILEEIVMNGTPLPKGKWTKQYQNVNGTDFEIQNKVCSECNKSVKYKYPFCPWCGADMRGDE